MPRRQARGFFFCYNENLILYFLSTLSVLKNKFEKKNSWTKQKR